MENCARRAPEEHQIEGKLPFLAFLSTNCRLSNDREAKVRRYNSENETLPATRDR